jgi:hypothetical protein
MDACGILDISSYAPLTATDFGAPHRKEHKTQPEFRTRMTRIAGIFTDLILSAFIYVHPHFSKNRQTLSAKLDLPNNIGNLCHQLWQKFPTDEKLQQTAAEFLLHCNSLTIGARNMQFHLRLVRNSHHPHFGTAHRKKRKVQPQFRTRMTRIGRIFTDIAYPRASAFHHVCSSLKNPASGASVSAFIRIHLRFFKNVSFQTGLTGSTGYVFNPVHPFILSNLKCQLSAPQRSTKLLREWSDANF